MNTKISLTKAQYDLLDAAYLFFNKQLFNSELPECMIVLHRKKSSRGYFHAERYVDRESVRTAKKKAQIKSYDELALNPDTFDRTDTSILSTLVHEMCHVWQYRCTEKGKEKKTSYHDKIWAKKMEEVGLMPSTTGAPGGKKTGQKVTHYVIEGAAFEKHCKKFLVNRSIKLSSFQLPSTSSESKKNKIAYICPSCEVKAWGKPKLNIVCGDCGEQLEAA